MFGRIVDTLLLQLLVIILTCRAFGTLFRKYLALLTLLVFLLLVLMPLPGLATQIYRRVTMSPDGTILVKGMADAMVFDFRQATAAASMPSDLGLKGVTMGDCLYVFGEGNQKLRVDHSKNYAEARKIGNARASNTYEKLGGWPAWYGHFAQVLTKSWDATTPGQVQVLVQISRDGSVRLLKFLAYTPGKNNAGEFVTTGKLTTLENGLVSDIQSGLSNLNKSEISFPDGSTATSVKFLVNCIADRDLLVCFPALCFAARSMYDDRQLELIRIASIFESGYLYKQANYIRRSAGAFSIPPSSTHRIISPNCFLIYEHIPAPSALDKRSGIIDSIIEYDLRQSKFDALEGFAIKLVGLSEVLNFLDPIIFHELERQNRHDEAAAFKLNSDSSHWYPVEKVGDP